MGGAMSAPMEKMQDNMAKQQATMFARQVTMQRIAMERQMSMQIARSRDMVHFFGSFYGLAAVGLIHRARATGNRALVAPLLPLTFVLAYQLDAAYGTKIPRIRAEAEQILRDEYSLVQLPAGPIVPEHVNDVIAQRKGLHDK
uniref:Plasminogen receptor (KT) n=1 Tax=Bicosoecida sp. CB-2014 TaxID=1486930 RepID=A0A7S1GF16_9STRA|mmetsp:Transcript_8171/g.29033  ORF Transcript_8171/g.29033 Transcript_8171/m.29033 type:complete len:143 (+) Transcript_8171:195-623(+)